MSVVKSRVTLVVLSGFLSAMISPAMAGVQGSVHDFSGYVWSGGEMCVLCHAPHGTGGSVDAPLWNHEVTSTVFTLYDSATLWEIAAQPEPGSISRLCLSCHDGTVAIDSYGSTPGTSTYMDDINPDANLGTNLGDDHPVGILWNHQNGEQKFCTACHDPMNTTPVKNVKFYPVPGNPNMRDLRLECGTCHDVHDNTGIERLLRVSLKGSELCKQCHGK